MSIIINAAAMAAHYHRDQKRDHSGRPYITHLIRVAGWIAIHRLATEALVSAGFLHDILEDQAPDEETRNEICHKIALQCGVDVLNLVHDLTNHSVALSMKASRAERKKVDRQWLATRSPEVKLVKLIDRCDNLTEMSWDLLAGSDRYEFGQKYAQESIELLNESLRGVDPELEQALEFSIKDLETACRHARLREQQPK